MTPIRQPQNWCALTDRCEGENPPTSASHVLELQAQVILTARAQFLFYLHLSICMYYTHVWRSGDNLSSTMWVPGIELKSSGLASCTLTHKAISPAQSTLLNQLLPKSVFSYLGLYHTRPSVFVMLWPQPLRPHLWPLLVPYSLSLRSLI